MDCDADRRREPAPNNTPRRSLPREAGSIVPMRPSSIDAIGKASIHLPKSAVISSLLICPLFDFARV
jgi:hypothetical protein